MTCYHGTNRCQISSRPWTCSRTLDGIRSEVRSEFSLLRSGRPGHPSADESRTAEVLGLMRRFNRERGQTFVLATHDPEVGATCYRGLLRIGGPA